jgi:hypothetical protein
VIIAKVNETSDILLLLMMMMMIYQGFTCLRSALNHGLQAACLKDN